MELFKKDNNELRVVFGLRFENRTWLNQCDGFLNITKFLSEKYSNLSIIIDGHDFIKNISQIKMSHKENNNYNILEMEKSVVSLLELNFKHLNVKIIDAVGCSLDKSLLLINSADFFVAPWGAGLAKYKWICNLPGVVFTSAWNIRNKNDLSIYDDEKYRESSIKSLYVEEVYIQDSYESKNIISINSSEDFSRNDFTVNIQGLLDKIDQLLKILKV